MRPNRFSLLREEYIDRQEELWLRKIRAAQRRLRAVIVQQFVNTLDIRDGKVVVSQQNFRRVTGLDLIYRQFIATEAPSLIQYLVERAAGVMNLGKRYFREVTDFDDELAERAEAETFLRIGIQAGQVLPGGPVDRIFQDATPINDIKQSAMQAITGEASATQARRDIGNRTDGGEVRGTFERHITSSMPQPYAAIDRVHGTAMADKLQLNYAIYQGGTVRDSRPFCVIRNNRVFSREEIERFGTAKDTYGGYTNKANGEFQGKPRTGYNPFRDLGGYNCRHSLDYISDELAFRLRPELREATTA